MKRLLIILSAAALTAGAGCSNNEPAASARGYGRLELHCTPSNDIVAGVSTRAEVPAGEEFALRITGTDYDRSWETLAGGRRALRQGKLQGHRNMGRPHAGGLRQALLRR